MERGKANKFGKYSFANGSKYEGFWKDDTYHGEGTEVWEDGTVLKANYIDGLKEG